MNKRTTLKMLATSCIAIFSAKSVLAFNSWPEKLFNNTNSSDVTSLITENDTISTSDEITIKVPEIAENGAVVPITVSSTISNISTIAILVDNNPTPLTSSFTLAEGNPAYVSTRVKMAKTSTVTTILTTRDGKHYSSSKTIKVTIGGCGG